MADAFREADRAGNFNYPSSRLLVCSGFLSLMKPILLRIAICAGALLAVVSSQAAETYTFDQGHSTIGFEVRHLLGKARGQFHKFSGTIELDRDQPERSTVSARIEVASIDTGIVKRDNHLRSADFFDAARFPVITFKSRSVKRASKDRGDIAGDFTMHGTTRALNLHVQLLNSDSVGRSRWKVTTAPLKRGDFGLMFGGTAEAVSGIGQDVAVNIEIEATRQP
jgi:polyisoprenoid-binding protein YceI